MIKAAVGGLGNIGSSLVPLLPSLGIGSVVLVDKDVYEEKNLVGQSIAESYIGYPKADMQARRLSSINSKINVTACVDDIQNIPWKHLHCDVILGCFDNNSARQITAEFAWRMGLPYIDCGVKGDGMFARVDVYIPNGIDTPCIECSWKDSDYARLEVAYPCSKGRIQSGTDSPIYLGSLAASMQAAECARIIKGDLKNAGARIVLSAHSYTSYVSRLPRNGACRFDHGTFRIEQLDSIPRDLSLKQVLDSGDVSITRTTPSLFDPYAGQGKTREE
jgi:adenylyltransferase/sulfurtransferase